MYRRWWVWMKIKVKNKSQKRRMDGMKKQCTVSECVSGWGCQENMAVRVSIKVFFGNPLQDLVDTCHHHQQHLFTESADSKKDGVGVASPEVPEARYSLSRWLTVSATNTAWRQFTDNESCNSMYCLVQKCQINAQPHLWEGVLSHLLAGSIQIIFSNFTLGFQVFFRWNRKQVNCKIELHREHYKLY